LQPASVDVLFKRVDSMRRRTSGLTTDSSGAFDEHFSPLAFRSATTT
jgi:hypothetical protein